MGAEYIAYCEKCDKMVEYWIQYLISTIKHKKITFRYIEKICFCKECGSEIYVPDIADENCKRRKDAYRTKMMEKVINKFYGGIGR